MIKLSFVFSRINTFPYSFQIPVYSAIHICQIICFLSAGDWVQGRKHGKGELSRETTRSDVNSPTVTEKFAGEWKRGKIMAIKKVQ